MSERTYRQMFLAKFPTARCRRSGGGSRPGVSYGITITMPNGDEWYVNGDQWMTPNQAWERAVALFPKRWRK